MTSLRIVGLIIGISGMAGTFLSYRGDRWKRTNFFLFSLMSLALIVVSVYPDAVNILRDMLSLQEAQYGRLLALLVSANIFLLFFSFYSRAKFENIRMQFDMLIRKLGTERLGNGREVEGKIKPIMVLIPAYNESDNLKELLPKLPKKINGVEVGVLVINDGSNDGTENVVTNLGYLVVSNVINRGQGAASRLGYDTLISHDVLVGVTMDADNQHKPDEIEIMIEPILKGEFDLVIGSRILGRHERESHFRNLGISFFSKIISIILGIRITDCSSGFKAFNVKRLKDIHLTQDQFQSAEVLIEARKKGLSICEVPITITRRKYGQSKKGKNLSYGINFAKTIIKTWLR